MSGQRIALTCAGPQAEFADTVRAVIGRLHGDASTVSVFAAESSPGVCTATAEARGGRLELCAGDAVGALSAFSRYLQQHCGIRITWQAPVITRRPQRWPDGATKISTGFGIRYHLNVVTHGYSMAFWDWSRWERELDWMALHGITHPLILTGYECVLAETLIRLGLEPAQAWGWVGSAAHLPWMAMGCLHSFGGPLPESWARERIALARQILQRCRELGMTPVQVLPGGQVPPELAGDHAGQISWQGWHSDVIDPTSQRYRELVATFVAVQTELLGPLGGDSIFALDPFIESVPPVDQPAELALIGKGYHDALQAAAPGATWLLQGWPFHYHRSFWTDERVEGLLSLVPQESLLLIDLWGENAPMWRQGMYGRRWIWTALHNFGGRFALMGDLQGLCDDLAELRELNPPGLEGVGLAPEAIENNAVFYELATDLFWGIEDFDSWLATWARKRCGRDDPRAEKAWKLLLKTLYGRGRSRSIPSPVHARPWTNRPPFASQRTAGEALPSDDRPMSANVDAEADPRVLGDLPMITEAIRLLLDVAGPDGGEGSDSLCHDVSELTQHVLAQQTRSSIHGIARAGVEQTDKRCRNIWCSSSRTCSSWISWPPPARNRDWRPGWRQPVPGETTQPNALSWNVTRGH